MQTKYTVTKYSDELANGDSADNRELHEEEDMADDVVDFNGQTNRGYQHRVPREFVGNNTIDSLFPGHFGTVPREDVQLSG